MTTQSRPSSASLRSGELGDPASVARDAGDRLAVLSPCPICRSRGSPERYELREMLFGSRERFAYLRCRSCGALRIADPPGDMARHYPAAYYAGGTVAPVGPRPKARGLGRIAGRVRDQAVLFGRRRRLARLLRRWSPPLGADVRRWSAFTRRAGLRSFGDPILDVGSGWRPANLLSLRTIGFRRLLGIDPFLEADGEYEGIPLRRQSIHDVDGVFQAITFHHSFEHVPDPEETLVAAARCLRPGGVVLIRTPVMGTWFWERFGTDWWELDPPRHLWVHTQASLEQLAKVAGLALLDVVWESSFIEVIASDQISRDIAWREPASWYVNPPAGYAETTIESFRALTADLNRTGQAGRAGFYFGHAPKDGRHSPERGPG